MVVLLSISGRPARPRCRDNRCRRLETGTKRIRVGRNHGIPPPRAGRSGARGARVAAGRAEAAGRARDPAPAQGELGSERRPDRRALGRERSQDGPQRTAGIRLPAPEGIGARHRAWRTASDRRRRRRRLPARNRAGGARHRAVRASDRGRRRSSRHEPVPPQPAASKKRSHYGADRRSPISLSSGLRSPSCTGWRRCGSRRSRTGSTPYSRRAATRSS